ncbi:MAG: hypothetical protein NZ700_11810 [Gemmataceae bacterium]|nr:hypothetical protein [Gemmataceae bacterium]MDW8266850.1 hypothetical protein [Gemmataceae bacterium]
MRSLWRAETGFFLVLTAILIVGGRSRLFRDPGTFWHIVTGQRILQAREFLHADPYSCTFFGQRWVPYEWLGECVMAGLYAVGGFDTLLWASAVILAALYTWIAHRLLAVGLHGLMVTGVILLTLATSTSHFHVRPHIVSIIFLALTFAWLNDYEARRIDWRRLWWLVPLFVVWTNIHGGVLGGLGTMLLVLGGWVVYRLLGCETPGPLWGFSVLTIACGLTVFINPYGADLPRTWIEIMRMDYLPRMIVEHAPLDPRRLDGLLVLGWGGVYLATLAGTWPRWPRITWLVPLVWLVLACERIRHAPLFAVTAALAWADLWPHTRWAAWLARHRPDLYQVPSQPRSFPRRALMMPVCLVALAVILQAAGIGWPILGRGWARLDPSRWPLELLPELRAYAAARPLGTPIFNDYNHGGFLIWFTPSLRVFVDDRCEVYGNDWLREFDDAMKHHPERIEAWARQWGFDHALVEAGSPMDDYLRSAAAWVEVRRSEPAVLFRRREAQESVP